MSATDLGARIERARESRSLSQRALAEASGVPQSTLSRIIAGLQPVKMPEVVAIARATGHAVAQLTDNSPISERVLCVACATNDTDLSAMRDKLMCFFELNDYLEDQAIPAW
ncbi:helix-turn-helix domain-containing protein [Amycolatopsis pigmentata]|uniref:Helix-turn-helix domain-containing protein n=1 Tax=Amycolatopsis pigmentata TaxID=450801 RepID=A0ABW5G312_9PSEU